MHDQRLTLRASLHGSLLGVDHHPSRRAMSRAPPVLILLVDDMDSAAGVDRIGAVGAGWQAHFEWSEGSECEKSEHQLVLRCMLCWRAVSVNYSHGASDLCDG